MASKKITQDQEQVAKRFYGTKPEEWRRHRDGGWIHAGARFPNGEDECSIRPLGVVSGGVVSGGVVWGGVVKQSPIIVTGKYTMSPSKPGYITIGCETRTYKEWEQKGEDIAKSHGELIWYRKHVKPILPWFIKQSEELFKGQKVEDESNG